MRSLSASASASAPQLLLIACGLLLLLTNAPPLVSAKQFRSEQLAAFRKQRTKQQQNKSGNHDDSTCFPFHDKLQRFARGGATSVKQRPLMDVVRNYWYLGLLGFGGTPAHVALLHQAQQRDESSSTRSSSLTSSEFLELTSLLHAVPGPTSTQLVVATAVAHAGALGGIMAFLFWTLPGFGALCLAGLGRGSILNSNLAAWLQGIPPVAFVLSIQSVTRFASTFDGCQKLVAAFVCVVATTMTGKRFSAPQFIFPLLLTGGGLFTLLEDWGEDTMVFSDATVSDVAAVAPAPAVVAEKAAAKKAAPAPIVAPQPVERLYEREFRQQKTDDDEEISSLVDSLFMDGDFDPMLNSSSDLAPVPRNWSSGDREEHSALSGGGAAPGSWWNQSVQNSEDDNEDNNNNYTVEAVSDSIPSRAIKQEEEEELEGDNYTNHTFDAFDIFGDSDFIGEDNDYSKTFDDFELGASDTIPSLQPQPKAKQQQGLQGLQSAGLLPRPRGGSIAVNQQRRGGAVKSSYIPPGLACVMLWLSVFLATTFIRSDNAVYQIFCQNYKLGSALFGGGPIVVPLLAARAIQTSLSESQFFQGASMAQSLPGSLFNFAAYVGAMQQGGGGAIAAHVGILAPGCILAIALLPIWLQLREQKWFRSVLRGVTASGVGLLASACLATFGTCIQKGSDFLIFLLSAALIPFTDLPAPVMLVLGAFLGAIMSKVSLGQPMY